MSDSEDPIDLIDEGGDDLFGDDGDDDVASPKANLRDDDDLASDRDADGYGRDEDDDEDAQQSRETQERVVMGVRTYRHRIPKPQDGSVSLSFIATRNLGRALLTFPSAAGSEGSRICQVHAHLVRSRNIRAYPNRSSACKSRPTDTHGSRNQRP
jgi:hypothetical protein